VRLALRPSLLYERAAERPLAGLQPRCLHMQTRVSLCEPVATAKTLRID